MACEARLMFERFITSVALEWFFPSVLLHVFLQMIRSSAGVAALVTLVRLFSCVLPHHVESQFTSSDARKFACCASLWLFTRVRHIVLLQVACFCCFVFTLIALVLFFPNVLLYMNFEIGSNIARKVALWATVRFFPRVNEGVPLHVLISAKWFVALCAVVFLHLTVGLSVIGKASITRKCLQTHIARKLLRCPTMNKKMSIQEAWCCCFVFTLIAIVKFLPKVLHNMHFEVGRPDAWKVALWATVRFLPRVNEGVSFQVTIPAKWFVALCAVVFLNLTVGLPVIGKASITRKCLQTHIARKLLRCPTMNKKMSLKNAIVTKWLVTLLAIVLLDTSVGLLVIEKTTPTCKCLWTQVTRYLFGHLRFSLPLSSGAFCKLK